MRAAIEWRLVWIYWHCSRSTSHIVSGVYSIRKLHDWFQKTDNFESVSFVLSHFSLSFWIAYCTGYDKYARIHTKWINCTWTSKRHRPQMKISDTRASNKLQLHVCTVIEQCVYTSIELHIANPHLRESMIHIWFTLHPSIAFSFASLKTSHRHISFIHLCYICFVLFIFHMIFYCFCIDELKQDWWRRWNKNEETGIEKRMNKMDLLTAANFNYPE